MDLRTQEQRGASAPRSRVWRSPSASAAGETKPFVVKPPFLKPVFPTHPFPGAGFASRMAREPSFGLCCDHSDPRRLGKGPLTERC